MMERPPFAQRLDLDKLLPLICLALSAFYDVPLAQTVIADVAIASLAVGVPIVFDILYKALHSATMLYDFRHALAEHALSDQNHHHGNKRDVPNDQ
jgi:hypothetical protein